VTYGNGPQVGLLALQGEACPAAKPYPLDVLGAESEGSDVDASELRALTFAPGSMGPKVYAACRFAQRTGGLAGIGALTDAAAILRGDRGTRVRARARAAA
jgi:carbamate kinase